MKAPLPDNETARLEALCRYNILDTASEEAFDELTGLAAQICETPISLMTLVDNNRQWFKSKVGLTLSETPREISFCAHAILGNEVLVVRDALADERFATNPFVTSEPQIRFYAGAPLIASGGYALGTLCVIDYVPRELTSQQLGALQTLSRQIVRQLELRRNLAELEQAAQESKQLEKKEHHFFTLSLDLLCIADFDSYFKRLNPAWEKTLGYTNQELQSQPFLDFVHPEDQAATLAEVEKLTTGAPTIYFENRYRCKDGSYKWLAWTAFPNVEEGSIYAIARDMTANKQAEQERLQLLQREQAARNQIANILQSITDAFIALDNEWRFTYLNQQAEPLLQRKREELLGKCIWDEFPEAVGSPFYLEYHRAARERVSVEFEAFYPPLNTWFSVHAYPREQGLSVYFQNINERKQAEEALRSSEERYRLLFERNPQPMWVFDVETLSFLAVNQAAINHYGYSRDEFLGMTLVDIRPPEDVPAILKYFANNFKAGDKRGVWRHRKKDGSIIEVEITSHTLTFAGRQAQLVLANDVTERRRAQEVLETRMQQQAVVTALGQRALAGTELSALMDEATKLVAQSLDVEYCKVLELVGDGNALLLRSGVGWKPGLVGRATVGTEADSQAGYTLIASEPVIVEDLRTETRFSSPDLLHEHGVVSGLSVIIPGPNRPFGVLEAHTRRKRTFNQENVHFLQSVANVLATAMERQWAEEELRRQNRRSQLFAEITLKIRQSLQLEEILQTTVTEVQKILACDRVLLYRVWPNGTGCTVTEAVQPGWAAILGMTFTEEVFPVEYQELYRRGQVRAIADVEQAYADVTPCMVEFLKPWGVKAKLVVPILQNEELWGLLIAHHCTSTRQWTSFETELLQQLSEQIGLALAQAQLLEIEKRHHLELARSNAELEEFAYVASHDLQEPLRKIQAFGDRLKIKYGEVLTDQGRDYLERMQNAAIRMEALIDDLLTLSRVTTRAQPFMPTNLTQVVQEVLSDLEVRIQQTGGRIEVGKLPTLEADPIQMRQLLQNLIGNALKFHTAEEPPAIKIYSRRLSERERRPTDSEAGARTRATGMNCSERCQIFIEDNGIGFDEKYTSRIFNAFQRLHGRSEYEGTGMGLAICRKIVERHDGSITAQSVLGQGSTFVVTLPLQQRQDKK